MIDNDIAIESDDPTANEDLLRRRDYLNSLQKWSQAVIGAVVFGGLAAPPGTKADWVNRRRSWFEDTGSW